MKETGIVRIWTSILQRQNMVAQFNTTRPILDLCEKAVRRPGAQVPRRWWEQTGIDWIPEGGQGEGGSNRRSGRASIDRHGFGVQGRHTGWDREIHRGGGVPESKRLQRSGAEQSGAED